MARTRFTRPASTQLAIDGSMAVAAPERPLRLAISACSTAGR
jgi:hypothetical protein